MSTCRAKLFCGVYTHPHKRGFALSVEWEGWLGLRCLLWKWELSVNGRGIVPPAQSIDETRKREVAEEKRRRVYAEECLACVGVSNWNYD